MYWICETQITSWRNQVVQAKLLHPSSDALSDVYGPSFRDPMQFEPYGASIDLVFRVDSRHPHPDNYFTGAGFQLYSDRLVDVMRSFGVQAEYFGVRMVDKSRQDLALKYKVFHLLQGVLPAMDEIHSQWTGNYQVGIPRLVLDMARFDHRPLFICNHVYILLMRDDLKVSLQSAGISGFRFYPPEQFRSGQYGMPWNAEE